MRAAVYYSNSDVRIEERERPTPGPGELLLRIHASGVCGSDVMEWYRKPRAPLVLGHEIAGTVEEAGPGVTRFAPGDRVVATHHVPCNTCDYCLTDRHSVCDTLRTTTFDPGGFCEFVRLPAINVDRGTFVIPDGVSFEDATFVEPLLSLAELSIDRLEVTPREQHGQVFEEAKRHLEAARAIDDKAVGIRVVEAHIAALGEDAERAVMLLKEETRLHPGAEDGWLIFAQILAIHDRNAEAIEVLAARTSNKTPIAIQLVGNAPVDAPRLDATRVAINEDKSGSRLDVFHVEQQPDETQVGYSKLGGELS